MLLQPVERELWAENRRIFRHGFTFGAGSKDQWNWPSSVEPVNAVVDEVGSTVVAIRSK